VTDAHTPDAFPLPTAAGLRQILCDGTFGRLAGGLPAIRGVEGDNGAVRIDTLMVVFAHRGLPAQITFVGAVHRQVHWGIQGVHPGRPYHTALHHAPPRRGRRTTVLIEGIGNGACLPNGGVLYDTPRLLVKRADAEIADMAAAVDDIPISSIRRRAHAALRKLDRALTAYLTNDAALHAAVPRSRQAARLENRAEVLLRRCEAATLGLIAAADPFHDVWLGPHRHRALIAATVDAVVAGRDVLIHYGAAHLVPVMDYVCGPMGFLPMTARYVHVATLPVPSTPPQETP